MPDWIESFLAPKTAHRSLRLTIGYFALAATLSYVSQKSTNEGFGWAEPLMEPVLAVLFFAASFYLIMAGVLTWREKQRDIARAESVEYLPQAADYRSVNYSQLPIERQVMSPDVPIYTGITMLTAACLGLFLLISTATGKIESPLDSTTIGVLWLLNIALVLGGIGLCWLGWRLNRQRKQGSFEGFLADNGFAMTRRPQVDEFRSFYDSILEQTRSIRLSKLLREMSGQYRGRSFWAAAIEAGPRQIGRRNRDIFYGVLIYPYAVGTNTDLAKKTPLIESYQTNKGITVCFTNKYLVIYSNGLPSKRASMIRLFQSLDGCI